MSDGKATVVKQQAVDVVVDGACLLGTLGKLREGYGAKPMPDAALTKVRADAVRLLEAVVDAYERRVASGEVGATGSGRASSETPSAGTCPTGLLYGRVQSGKTVAMITFCAAAIDNGFRVVVVLTSDFVKLVEQTAERFGALDGPLIKNALQSEAWTADAEHVKKHIAKHGVVFICTKNQQRLSALVDFLEEIGAADYPGLVLDDEADQATLDTTTRARSSGRKNAPKKASAIHRKTVEDDEGQSIRQMLRHHVFVQVTATPYALLLQNVDNPLRPNFTTLLEPGANYTGGEKFFDVNHVENGDPPLVFVDEAESAKIESSDGGDPPLGLQQAVAFFLIAAAAQNLLDPGSSSIGQNFLCHTSHKQTEHDRVARLIRAYVNKITDDLDRTASGSETMMRLTWALDELRRTISDPPSLDPLVERIKRRLPRRDVPVVNSANSRVDFGRELNFIVGGNILGRGLTIENLLVTYYLRRAKISQMDTVLQHARMYGYRQALMPFTRVFLPEDLGARFHFIHVAEQSLRAQLGAETGRSTVTVETMTALRATRLNVLDANTLCAYEPGGHIFPGGPDLSQGALKKSSAVEADVKRVFGGTLRDGGFVPLEIAALVALLRKVPYNEDLANLWDPAMLELVLLRLAPRYSGQGLLYYRTMQRRKPTFPTGALSGDELKDMRSRGAPVLCVFRDDGRALADRTGGRDFWYPTLVFPSDMPTQVFNTTA